ncbi:MAG TPA: thioredoxin family protein [Polyangiaceae bacterium]
MKVLSSLGAAIALSVVLAGCESGRSPGTSRVTAEPSAPSPQKNGAHVRPLFVRGPTGGAAIAPFVAEELRRGRRSHRGVLVYVGATWCEPCQGFHRAVEQGELDELLDGVRLVEFDLDQDWDALDRAGYLSPTIPLFALPKVDGTSSEHRIEGSVKGPAAVEQNLMPRLRGFLKGQTEG